VGKCLLHCGAGVAGIHGVATKPEACGRGIARVPTVAALSSAVDDGYKVGVPHSSPMAVTLYWGLGFRDFAEFALYGPPDGFHL
jgi:ribosomal protein S18 acetylase RimI-like enzyme